MPDCAFAVFVVEDLLDPNQLLPDCAFAAFVVEDLPDPNQLLPDCAFAVFLLEALPDPNQLPPDFVELTLEGFLVFEVVDFEYVFFLKY